MDTLNVSLTQSQYDQSVLKIFVVSQIFNSIKRVRQIMNIDLDMEFGNRGSMICPSKIESRLIRYTS